MKITEVPYIPHFPSLWIRLNRVRFSEWWAKDKVFWIGVGKQRVAFPFCCCAIDEDEETIIYPCAMHAEWKKIG